MKYILNPVDVAGIVRGVAEVYNVTPGEIMGQSRFENIAEARQAAMVLTWKAMGGRPGCTTATGRLFNRDHGTVLHARRAIEAKFKSCKATRKRWLAIRHLAIPTEQVPDYQI